MRMILDAPAIAQALAMSLISFLSAVNPKAKSNKVSVEMANRAS